MNITCAIAMTGAEFSTAQTMPRHVAWMACHFSQSGNGLSNLPGALPTGAFLLIDDSIPLSGHDPGLIATQLKQLAQQHALRGIVLDLQRKDLPENAALAEFLVFHAPCPVCISAPYAEKLDCPVFLPPPLLHQPLEEQIGPWKNREIWLEAILETQRITVTAEGSHEEFLPFFPLNPDSFTDEALCCRYQIKVLEDRAIFSLSRDRKMLQKLLERADRLGVRGAIGLYQQLGGSFSL